MDLGHVAAALLSALLHAGWNAAVKTSRWPAEAMTAQMVLSAALALPILLWSGLPDRASLVWVALSTLLNMLAVLALLRAYERGGFGLVYPTMRAVAVLFVVPLSAALAGDRVGLGPLCGIVIIAIALGALAYDAARERVVGLEALGWTLAAGLCSAACILSDGQGVRAAGSPWAYGCVSAVANASAMCWRRRRAGSLWGQLQRNWAVGAPTAVAAMVSYLLILWVWSGAPIAPAAALRDTSAIFAILIAVVWLREPFTLTRILAVVLAAAAVPLLRLG